METIEVGDTVKTKTDLMGIVARIFPAAPNGRMAVVHEGKLVVLNVDKDEVKAAEVLINGEIKTYLLSSLSKKEPE